MLLLLRIGAADAATDRLGARLVVETWQTREGLPHNSIGSMVRTPEGYLWLATQLGLVRFDGVRFTLFDTTNTPALTRDHIQSLAVGRDGGLWIGTSGGGLAHWSLADGIRRVELDGVPDDLVVEAVHEDPDGVLWIGSQGRGLYRVEGRSVRRSTKDDGLPSNTIAAICSDSDGGLWLSPTDTLVASSGPLARLTEGGITSYTTEDGLPGAAIQSLSCTADGDVLIATDGGLARWNGARFEVVATAETGLPTDHAWGAVEGPAGELWVATDEGLARVGDEGVDVVEHAALVSQGVPLCLLADAEGSVWIGRWDSGLVRIRPAAVTVLDHRDGLVNDFTWAVHAASDGVVWVGTDAGLTRFGPDGAVSWTEADGLPNPTVRSVAGDGADGVWLGTQGGGACHLTEDGLRVLDRSDGLPDDVVYTTFEDRRGTVWIGTAGGLAAVTDDDVSVLTESDGLSSDVIRNILEDRDGRMLVGTNLGLDVVADGRATPLAPELVGDFVLSLYESADGVLWIGTNGSGLVAVLDGEVIRFLDRGVLDIPVVYKAVEDDDGFLWLSGNTGVTRVARRALLGSAIDGGDPVAFTTFDARDGLLTAECNGGSQSSGARAADGRIWFPTMRGVAVVDPASVASSRPAPAVLVESVTVDGKHHRPTAKVASPPGRGAVEIEYTALELLVPSRIGFRYRLVGHDDDWVDAGTDRVARYSSLPPGAYRFEVAARHSGGAWGEPCEAVEIELEPHLVETTGFRVAGVLVLLAIVWLGHRLRVRQLRARAVELQREVDAALAELKVLSGMLPICASCKKIRDDSGAYVEVEDYITGHSEAVFSHSLCDECSRRLYPDAFPD